MQTSSISDIKIGSSHDSIRSDEILTLSLSFSIDGLIRENFSQKNWERAYDKHDNGFRLTISLDLKVGRNTVDKAKIVRKAVLFWTRNPKLPYRVWVSIIKDETPHYPLTIEEAISLLFDVTKTIDLDSNKLKEGENEIKVSINVSWGKHLYTDPVELHGETKVVKVNKT
ncbi:MAG TPA: hypothetical protein VLD84_05355 [Nitrososphaeraceae archaeon]|nr:hypothetical protein [Nitrososphaeraceae archaeon]